MATTDSNGILFYEDTDAVSPLHTLLNTGQTSVTNAVSALKDGSGGEIVIHYVADTATRATAATAYSPTTSKPLYVYRGDAAVGSELEATEDGTTWRTLGVSTLPHLRIKQAAAQSRPGAAWGQIAFGTTAETAGSQPWTEASGAITVTSAGLYNIESTVSMASAAFAVKILNWTTSATLAQGPLGAGASFSASLSTTQRLAANTLILVQVYPTSTMSVTADSATTPTFVSITKLSD